jgi:hypothetical protein
MISPPELKSDGRLNLTPLRWTAIDYLKEALLLEQYEIIDDIIECAYEFGADEALIQEIIYDFIEAARLAPEPRMG